MTSRRLSDLLADRATGWMANLIQLPGLAATDRTTRNILLSVRMPRVPVAVYSTPSFASSVTALPFSGLSSSDLLK